MLNRDEMIRLQSDSHELIETKYFRTCKDYVLHLIHARAYEYAADMAAGKSALDLGCNTGYGSRILAGRAAAVAGVDVSPRAIELARANGGDIDFQVIDGRSLPFRDAAFNLIVSFQVIEHIVDYSAYIGEMQRVLAPGGTVLFTTPNGPLRLHPGMQPWNPFHVREFSHTELEELLQRYFPRVKLLGLFAREPLYSFEKQRVALIRERARLKQNPELNPIARWLRIMVLKLRASISKRSYGSVRRFQDRYSTQDLYYAESDLPAALDLLAVCQVSLDPAIDEARVR